MVAGHAVLAIDGPAGAGKSTVSRSCAERLGLTVLDTGAMYRAVTLVCLQRGVDLVSEAACTALTEALTLDQHGTVTRVDGVDVSTAIRAPEVTQAVSTVSAHPGVRHVMVKHQREWAARHGGGVVEGRDIGTVVFPDARLKVFLIASDEERALRRQADERAAGREVPIEELLRDLARRDRLDTERATSPLKAADDAILVDTTGRSIEAVVDEIVRNYETAA